MNKKIIVIGAGPAGMMAATKAAENGADVTLIEKMDRVGRKMLITGKGRCNMTNAADIPEIIKNIPGTGAFLNSSIRAFTNDDVVDFFHELGVPTKVERGGRVFPVSDKASDVVDAMLERLHELDVKIWLKTSVSHIAVRDGVAVGVVLSSGETIDADAVILTTGGASYPRTGSTGDGARMAKEIGHSVTKLLPALVPLETDEPWVPDLMGLSLKNVSVRLMADDEKIAEDFGEMMFTHFGVTGPIILSLSRTAVFALEQQKNVELIINLKPALTPEKLVARINRDFAAAQTKAVHNVLHALLPVRLIDVVLDLSYIDGMKKTNQVTKEERMRLADTLQHLTVAITKPRPIDEAIVTVGGIATDEVNPKTMASKRVKNLYIAGEVMDVDGFTGGYNLQAAFSMGAAAGKWSAIS